jgi:fatty acid synthase subunit beta
MLQPPTTIDTANGYLHVETTGWKGRRWVEVPTGWEAGRYGIPEDIIAQTNRALWALVCTAEALNASGITDPYELYKHMHPSEVGTSIRSSMGGVTSMAQMFKDRRDEKRVQTNILQET